MRSRDVVRFAAFAIIVAASAADAIAQDVVGGWEGDRTRGYAFFAPTASFDVDPTQAVLLRATGSFLYYGSEANGPTDVTSPGLSVGLGYRVSRPRVSGAFVVGFEERRIRRSRRLGETATWEQGAAVSGEMFVSANALTQVIALVNWGQANEYAWGRFGLTRQLSNSRFTKPRAVKAGIEVTAQGNRDVKQYQAGGVVEVGWLSARSSLQIRAGYGTAVFTDGGRQPRPYVGIGVYRHL